MFIYHAQNNYTMIFRLFTHVGLKIDTDTKFIVPLSSEEDHVMWSKFPEQLLMEHLLGTVCQLLSQTQASAAHNHLVLNLTRSRLVSPGDWLRRHGDCRRGGVCVLL